jgi:transcriptional regulator with XRE-family HTH domain
MMLPPLMDAAPAPPTSLGPHSLGEALRMLRHRTRINRDELARAANVSAGAISNYENDVSTPSAATLRRVTQALAPLLGVPAPMLWEQLGEILDAQDLR